MDRISQYKAVQNEAISLFKKKNQDYVTRLLILVQ